MHRTTGAGNVSGAFVDEVPGVSQGTTVEEDWLNTVQEELVESVETAGLTLNSAQEDQLAEAIQKLIAERGKQLGELFFLDSYVAPSAWDRANPEDYFAGVCLTGDDKTLSEANWPDLVPHLLARKLTYNEGKGGAKSAYDVTNWAVATNEATLTFADQAAETAVLAALAEDNLVHGSYTDWRTVTLPSAIGNIPAGTYALTDVDPAARTVQFSVTAADGSGAVSATAEFHPYRIAGSSTTARILKAAGRAVVSANDADSEGFAGLRRRDRLQGHYHEPLAPNTSMWGGGGDVNSLQTGATTFGQVVSTGQEITDGVNGTPRTGPTTDPRAVVGHLYLWGRRYVA